MRTRLLESKDTLRATVSTAEVLKTGASSVTFKTTATMAAKKQLSFADSEMVNSRKLAQVGQPVEGRLQLDIVSDTILRIRYAEGTTIPDNVTPMVVGTPRPPARCRINTKAKATVLTTPAMSVLVTPNPFRVEISDPKGRRVCGIGGPEKDFFGNWDSYNTGLCRTTSDGSPLAVESFDLRHDEAIYGFGEKFGRLNKVGQTLDLDMVDALGVTTPRSYKNIPFFVSTNGYGVFFNHSSLMTCWVGSLSAVDLQVAAEDDFLDYYVFLGSIKQVLASYTDLTGKGALPPKWSFGYWQSKISYQAADETLEIARQMRAHKIPCDVIHLDTHWFKDDWYCDLEFDQQRFPDPKTYLAELARLGIKVSLWQLPYIPEGSTLFNDLKAVDGFVKNPDGSIFNLGVCFTPGFKGIVGVVDYTNPAAVKVHQDAFRRLFRLGAKVIKTDFGEGAPLAGVYHDGTPGHRMHNLYPLIYNKALFEVTREETGDGVVWARSAWAGNQRYPLHWGGDNSPNYFNMEPQLAGGLSFGLSGFQFWSQDIGGFCGTTNDKLLIRWMQMGMFLSHSRIHGFGDRELYKFAAPTMKACRDYIHLRYRLMPYLYGSAARCVAESLPMARALVVEFQDDPNVRNLSDEFLLGDSLLVAPVFDETDRRRVYLPAGTWTNWWNGKRIEGPCWIEQKADLKTLPLYIREGGVIPMGPVMNYVDEIPVTRLDLLVSLFPRNGRTTFTIPVNREQIPVVYTACNGKHILTVGKTDVRIRVKTFGKGTLALRKK